MKLKFLKKAEKPAPQALHTAEALPAAAVFQGTNNPATSAGPKGSRSLRCRTFFQGGTEQEAAMLDKELNAFLAAHNVLTLQFDRLLGRLVCRVLYRV